MPRSLQAPFCVLFGFHGRINGRFAVRKKCCSVWAFLLVVCGLHRPLRVPLILSGHWYLRTNSCVRSTQDSREWMRRPPFVGGPVASEWRAMVKQMWQRGQCSGRPSRLRRCPAFLRLCGRTSVGTEHGMEGKCRQGCHKRGSSTVSRKSCDCGPSPLNTSHSQNRFLLSAD